MRLDCLACFLLWATSSYVNFAVKGLCALFSVKAGPHTISTIDEKKFTDCYGYDMETTLAAIDAEIGSLP